VAADELAGLDVLEELAREVTATLLFGFAAAIGEEDVRYMDTKFILAVEHPHRLKSLGDGLAATDKNAIDIKGKDE